MTCGRIIIDPTTNRIESAITSLGIARLIGKGIQEFFCIPIVFPIIVFDLEPIFVS